MNMEWAQIKEEEMKEIAMAEFTEAERIGNNGGDDVLNSMRNNTG